MKILNNAIERDINRIRLEIYEETKDMTPEQRVEHTRKATDDTIKKYGFRIVESVRQNTTANIMRNRVTTHSYLYI